MANSGEFRKKLNKSKMQWWSDGTFAIGLFVGIAIAIVVWLIVDMTLATASYPKGHEFAPSVAAVLIAGVSLFLSFFALREQKIVRQAGIDPVLVAHLGQREDEPIVMQLKISNIGAGAAMNVFADVEIPQNLEAKRTFGSPFEEPTLQNTRPHKVILQGKSVNYSLGTGPNLIGKEPLEPFQISLSYQDIEGNEYSSLHLLDVREFSGLSAAEPPLTKVQREIEKLRKALEK